MRYLLITINDEWTDDDTFMPIEHIACGLAYHLRDDLGLIAKVICPIPTKLLKAIEKHL